MEPLLSQRYAPFNHHPRPQHTPALPSTLNSIILHTPLPPPTLSTVPKHPFRLLALPSELRQQIYAAFYSSWEVTLTQERLSMRRSIFHVHGVPPVTLLQTCRQIYTESYHLRTASFNGRLNLHSVFILLPLGRKERFEWLRQNVRILHFSDSSVHPERWNRYYDNFPNLEVIEIEFPSVVRLGIQCASLEDVLAGKCDAVLLESLDTFRLALVDQLSEMVTVVVSQRYCLVEGVVGWQGVLDVRIQLASSGTRIVARYYDKGVSVVSKRQFRRPAEL